MSKMVKTAVWIQSKKIHNYEKCPQKFEFFSMDACQVTSFL